MSNINENSSSLLSDDSVDINLPIQTKNLLNINNEKQQPDKEENMTLSSSCIEQQEILEKNRKRKFDELDNKKMMKKDEEEDKEKQRSAVYENISDYDIKERLFKTMTNDVDLRMKIQQWLDTDRTLLLFIRQHATLLANYYSLKMKLELYQSYIHMTESVLPWLSAMSKTILTHNNINNQFFKIQKYVSKQLKNSEEEFNNITAKLAQSMSDQQYVSKSTAVDMKLLTSLIVIMVREDQQRFNVEFIQKRHLLMLNAKDVRLVHEFYHLQPDSQQLQMAEQIWQATIDEQRNKNTIQSNPHNKVKIVDYELQIETQKKLFLTHNNREEKEKHLLSSTYLKLNIDVLMNIIESRQKILRQRLEFDSDFNQTFPMDDDDGNKQ